jgi:hypothetical protein
MPPRNLIRRSCCFLALLFYAEKPFGALAAPVAAKTNAYFGVSVLRVGFYPLAASASEAKSCSS